MRSFILIFVIGLFFANCNKVKVEIDNLNGDQIEVLGHAGMGFSSVYPVNSLESILNCLALGANGTELDVQLTADNILVAFHDENLSNNTNAQGVVNSMKWQDLKDVNYNSAPYSSYSIISLDNLFSIIPDHAAFTFILDVKIYNEQIDQNQFYENYSNAFIALFNKYDLGDHVIIESQSKDFLSLVHSKKEQYKLFYYVNSFQDGISTVQELGITGMTISTKNITSTQIDQAHENGIFVTLWDVGSKADNREAVRKNPDMIMSDKVKFLIEYLNL